MGHSPCRQQVFENLMTLVSAVAQIADRRAMELGRDRVDLIGGTGSLRLADAAIAAG